MRNSILFCFLVLQAVGFAQSAATFERAGDKSMSKGNFYEAMLYYQSALAKRDDAGLYAKIGQAAFESHSFNIAEKYLSKIADDKKLVRKYPDAAYYLAETYRYLGNYNAAKSVFAAFDGGSSTNSSLRDKATLAAADLTTIAQFPSDTTLKINKLDKVNSEYSDFAPMQIGDTLYYSSMRFPFANDRHQPPRVFAKVMYSQSLEKGKVVNYLDPKDTTHVAHLTINPQQNRMVFTKCIYLNDNNIQCKLYERRLDKNGKWSKPTPLPEVVNPIGYTSTHPQLSFDSLQQKEALYFVSDRPGGKGKMDIWSCEISGNAYSKPVNLAAVNTADNEVSPFYDPKEKLLYFSSQGRGGLGGYDIFKYQVASQKTENLGTPYNSSFDDLYFSPTKNKEGIFFSSNRPGSQYLDKNNQTCCYDIYRGKFDPKVEKITPPLPKLDSLVAMVAPKVDPPVDQGSPVKVEKTDVKKAVPTQPQTVVSSTPVKTAPRVDIPAKDPIVKKTVEPEKTKTTSSVVAKSVPPIAKAPSNSIVSTAEKLSTLLPIVLFYDNDEPDKRTTETNTLKNYADTYYYYHQKKEVFKQEYASGGKQDAAMLGQLDDFFENEVEIGMFKLNQFSEAVYKKLTQGIEVEVFIQGFTSPRATTAYNLTLAQRRINCIKNHFRTWKFGALQQFLNSGALKISEKPLGETQAPSDVSDDLEDLPASVYDVRASRERRVELVEVREN